MDQILSLTPLKNLVQYHLYFLAAVAESVWLLGLWYKKLKLGFENMTFFKRASRPLWSPENLLVFVSALSAPNRSLMDWRIMAL